MVGDFVATLDDRARHCRPRLSSMAGNKPCRRNRVFVQHIKDSFGTNACGVLSAAYGLRAERFEHAEPQRDRIEIKCQTDRSLLSRWHRNAHRESKLRSV